MTHTVCASRPALASWNIFDQGNKPSLMSPVRMKRKSKLTRHSNSNHGGQEIAKGANKGYINLISTLFLPNMQYRFCCMSVTVNRRGSGRAWSEKHWSMCGKSKLRLFYSNYALRQSKVWPPINRGKVYTMHIQNVRFLTMTNRA